MSDAVDASEIVGAVHQGEYAPCAITFSARRAYAYFAEEHGEDGSDVILHFYPVEGKKEACFTALFPTALQSTWDGYGKDKVTDARAKYTEELRSWWLRFYGCDRLTARDAFVLRFLDKLDAAVAAMDT